jgi:hypothetical protein
MILEYAADSELKQVGVSNSSETATLILCMLLLDYGLRVKRPCSSPLYRERMMNGLISVSKIQKSENLEQLWF